MEFFEGMWNFLKEYEFLEVNRIFGRKSFYEIEFSGERLCIKWNFSGERIFIKIDFLMENKM